MNGRSWKIVLVASLVLNVFLVGAIVGGAYQWFTARGATAPVLAQQRALRFAAETLSAERQKAFVEGLKDARRDGRQYAREGREGRRRSSIARRSTPRSRVRAKPTAICARKWKAVWPTSRRACRPRSGFNSPTA
jgi:uncharacterized membrane protein